MKKILLFYFTSITSLGFCQSWTYSALGENFSDNNYITCSLKDSVDNIYIAGDISECYHCNGANGIFISKISPTGVIVWSDTIVNRPHYNKIVLKNMFFKNDGSLSLSGTLRDSINFMGFMLNVPQLTYTGYYAEIDVNGNCVIADTLPYLPLGIVKNIDNTLSIAGQTNVPITNLNYLPPSGYFVGNFIDYANANWISDLPGSLDASNYAPAMSSSPQNAIYIVDKTSNISKHTSSSTSNLVSAYQNKLEYIDDKLYGLSGAYWFPGTINIFDTTGGMLQQKTFGNNNVQSFTKHAQGFAIGGMFKDSLVYNGTSYYYDTSGLYRMYLLEVDSNWAFQNFQMAKQAYGSGGIWPEFIFSNGSDLFIQGPITTVAVFGNDTLIGGCCDYSSCYYARMSFAPLTSIEPINKNSAKTSVFMPNPCIETTRLVIENTVNTKYLLTVFTSSGILAKQYVFSGNELTLEKGDFSSGLYFYLLTNDAGKIISSNKLIIQ